MADGRRWRGTWPNPGVGGARAGRAGLLSPPAAGRRGGALLSRYGDRTRPGGAGDAGPRARTARRPRDEQRADLDAWSRPGASGSSATGATSVPRGRGGSRQRERRRCRAPTLGRWRGAEEDSRAVGLDPGYAPGWGARDGANGPRQAPSQAGGDPRPTGDRPSTTWAKRCGSIRSARWRWKNAGRCMAVGRGGPGTADALADYDAAEADHGRAIELEPGRASAFAGRGHVRHNRGFRRSLTGGDPLPDLMAAIEGSALPRDSPNSEQGSQGINVALVTLGQVRARRGRSMPAWDRRWRRLRRRRRSRPTFLPSISEPGACAPAGRPPGSARPRPSRSSPRARCLGRALAINRRRGPLAGARRAAESTGRSGGGSRAATAAGLRRRRGN